MVDELPPPGSRMEILMHRQIELQEEQNRLLGEVLRRLPPVGPILRDFAEAIGRHSGDQAIGSD